MRRITKTAWFGPKRIGWGWRPVSWQGWAVALLFLALIIIDVNVLHGSKDLRIGGAIVLVLGLLLITRLTGSRSGGPGS